MEMTPPPGDLSVKILDSVFGVGWQSIATGTDPAGGAGAVTQILSMFNALVLSATIVMMIYVIMVGIVGTAHEGKPLGSRYSTIWTPLRTIFSVSLLMPLPWAGVSLLQALMMSMIYGSIGFASGVWGLAADHLQTRGTITTSVATAPATLEADSLTAAMLQIRARQASFVFVGYEDPGGDLEWRQDPASMSGSYVFNAKAGPYTLGNVSIPCPAGADDPLCEARKEAFYELVSAIDPEAIVFLEDSRPVSSFALSTAANRYAARIAEAAPASAMFRDEQKQIRMSEWREKAQNDGWLGVASYYWSVSRESRDIGQAVAAPPVIATVTALEVIPGEVRAELSAVEAAAVRWSDSRARERSGGAGGGYELLGGLVSLPSPAEWLAGSGDPVVQLAGVGHGMISTGHALAGTVAAAGTAAATANAVSGVASGIPIVGGIVNAVATGASAIMSAGLTTAKFLLVPLYVLGATLAYYVPAIPMILWILAVVGWLLMVMQCIIAAPLWAAAHAIPEGEGLAGAHGRQGYLLFLGVLIRPPLMVVGLLLSAVLASGIFSAIGSAFSAFAGDSMRDDIVGYVTMSLIMTGLVLTVMHKLYGLITFLPDQAMSYIGHLMQGQDSSSDEAAVARAASGAAPGLAGSAGRLQSLGSGRAPGAGTGAGTTPRPGAGSPPGSGATPGRETMHQPGSV